MSGSDKLGKDLGQLDPALSVSSDEWIARLKEAAESGQCVDLAPGEDLQPADGATWSPDRQVPAAAVREVLTCTDLDVDSRGLRIRGARFVEALDLDYVVFHHPLDLIECSLEETLRLTGAKFLALNLRGTHLPGMDMEWSEIAGSVFAGEGFEAAGDVRASGARIKGQLDLGGAKLKNVNGCALNLNGAEIGGSVFAGNGFEAYGEIRAWDATIKGQLDLNGATLNNPNGVALNLFGAQIGSSVFAGDGFEAHGEILAWDATIKGLLSLSGATLNNPNGRALSLFGAEIGSSVVAGGGFQAHGEVRASAAKIKGQLFLSGATFNNPNGRALNLNGTEIAGNVIAGDGLRADGEILAKGAKIKGTLSFSGATLNNPNGRALNLNGAETAGNVVAGNGFQAHGEILAKGAKIKGDLRLSGATLNNPNRCALNIFGTEIGSSMFAGDGLRADGEVLAWAARIKGQLFLSGATLNNPNGCVLSLSGAEIGDNVVAGDGFRADGTIRAVGTTINGDLRLSGATLNNPNRCALNLKVAKLGVLTLAPKSVEGSIVLDRAVIEDLVISTKGPPPVAATGWTLGDIHGPLRYDWRIAKHWLNTASPSTNQLQRYGQKAPTPVQPWYELADVYERNGAPAAARHLRFAAANKTTKQSPWPTKLVRWVYRLLAGNGYYPLMAAVWLLAAVVAGSLLVSVNREDIFPPHEVLAQIQPKKNQLPPVTAETPCADLQGYAQDHNIEDLREYPCLNSFAFAVNNILPAAGGVIESDWVVAPDATRALTLGLPLLKFTAWALAALLLAGVTGLLRKT